MASGTNIGLELLKDKITIEGCWIQRGYNLLNDSVWHNGLVIYLISKK